MATKKEIKQIEEEKDWWEEISYHIPEWKLLGWIYKHHATFITGSHFKENTIHITGTQRDELVAAFEEKYNKGYDDNTCGEYW